MTAAALEGRTDREAAQYAAAQAVGFQLIARHINACAAEDLEILGLAGLPEPRPEMWAVTKGTEEERKARIDAWAKRHGIKAGPDEASGQYRAVLGFGPKRLIVYMIPDRTMADRLAAFYGAVREGRDVPQPRTAVAAWLQDVYHYQTAERLLARPAHDCQADGTSSTLRPRATGGRHCG